MADGTKDQSGEEAGQVNNLIQGRAKRSTAGRHMSALLNAEADDDLALLFEEVEDDNDFFEVADGEAGDEDELLESSSDDDDQGPNAQDDDFEGEQELQKEAKAETKKRRKQQQPFNLQTLRKRVKIDPVAVPAESAGAAGAAVSAPRPKKKSERISWLPTVDEGPTRASSRRQTMQNKQVTHAKLKDSEEKRVRLIATMEEAAKRKAHLKPKEMTQAERLAEAERVERLNSKSLNRWEEMEKRKAEERIAKIEALQNRRLEGPVISYWSGIATWVNGRLTHVGKADITQKKLERDENNRKKSKKAEKDDRNGSGHKPSQVIAVEIPTLRQTPAPDPENAQGPVSGNGETAKQDQAPLDQEADYNVTRTQRSEQANKEKDDQSLQGEEATVPTTDATAAEPAATSKDAPGTEEPPPTEEARKEPAGEASKGEDAMDVDEKPAEPSTEAGPEAQEKSSTETALQSAEVEPDVTPKEALPPAPTQAAAPEIATPSRAAAAAAGPESTQTEEVPTPTPQEQLTPEIHMDQAGATSEGGPVPGIHPPPPATIEQTGRTLTILENFDDKTAHSREYSMYFNAKKPPRLTKISSSLCVITSLPSRYRDPDTSLPFANAYAHKEIQHTVDQRYVWSPMLGCYVGPAGVAARGVPERFLGGSAQAGKAAGAATTTTTAASTATPGPTESREKDRAEVKGS